MSHTEFPELSCYLLPGHTTTPADAITEAAAAEELGLGRVWLSERFDVKDAGVICSAALATTRRIHVATAATNLHTRHPLVLATMCSSLHYLSEGRFELGLSRGVALRNQLMGLENVNNKKFVEGIELLRTLWSGESVLDHKGELGHFPYLSMGKWMDAQIPLHFVGFGPASLKFAGGHFDGIHLHTFITPHGLKRARAFVQAGAEKAGRDPDAVKLHAVLATACNPSREDYLRKIVARMATYMQAPGYAELLIQLNEWDPQVLEQFRASPAVTSIPGGIDSVATLDQLEEISELIPKEWLHAAVGTAEECARAWQAELDNGADSVVIHGSTPEEFTPVLDAYRELKHA
ncbi:TIGR03857 family LLM class F420-dependent oxidoreductase [Parahaliea maris]|uniref:TIGR03857 family LLM class F420-dependent oxidoreductase n=1 Tax=Parahaliea maris TaxID=2716870 RepID=A0A5C9A7W1_9GAMM|nr:TIGR03857 family LLM class F420-dependent oxidoreductase [Parahaliea maris]TXS96122.1 TIGR03857 family LLM class F420-dependent oxidoreductase [Parahaliea maris]